MKFRNGFNAEENEAESVRTSLSFDPAEDRASQADALETNINTIVARFRSSGVPPRLSGKQPIFGDFSEGFDLARAFQATIAAKEAFAQLSAEVRRRFNNDPLALAAFLADDRNRAEAERLGLVVKASEPVLEPPADVTPADGSGSGSGGVS